MLLAKDLGVNWEKVTGVKRKVNASLNRQEERRGEEREVMGMFVLFISVNIRSCTLIVVIVVLTFSILAIRIKI